MQAYQLIRKSIPYHSASKDGYDSSQSSQNDEDATLLQPDFRKRKQYSYRIFYYILVSVTSILVGLFAGQFFRVEKSVDGFMEPYGHVAHVSEQSWTEETLYMEDMSEKSEDAWDDLLPDGYGLVQHHKLAPSGNIIGAFHEMHCLHTLRKAYSVANYRHERVDHMIDTYLPARPAALKTPKVSSGDFTVNPYIEKVYVNTGRRPDPQYVKHCFEYLRQALMCAADSNLEDVRVDQACIKNKDDKIVEIFRSQSDDPSKRVCRDYEAIDVAWRQLVTNPRSRPISSNLC